MHSQQATAAREARPQAAAPESAAPADDLRRLDSARAESRRKRDSIVAEVRRLEAATPPPERSPLSDRGPFYRYTWVFYADVLLGALAGLAAFLIRQRDAPTAARRWWGIAGLIVGALTGAFVFVPAFVVSTMLSIGFSETPPHILFALTLLGILFVIASLVSFRRHRR